MFKNCAKSFKILQYDYKSSQIFQNCPNLSHIVIFFKMVLYGPKCSKLFKYGSKWSKVVQHVPKLSKMFKNCQKCSILVERVAKKSQILTNGITVKNKLKWSKMKKKMVLMWLNRFFVKYFLTIFFGNQNVTKKL